MFRKYYFVAIMILAAVLIGCMDTVKEKTIEVKPPADPLTPATTILQRYADGQPMTSEAASFPMLVSDVRKADPAKADILEKGFDELKKSSPEARKAKAKELLTQLQPAGK